MAKGENGATMLTRTAFGAGTKRAQVIERIDAGAMAILPENFYGVIADRANLYQLCGRSIDKSYLRTVTLAKRARTITAQVSLFVQADVPVVPCDANGFHRPVVVDLDRIKYCHRFQVRSVNSAAVTRLYNRREPARLSSPAATSNMQLGKWWAAGDSNSGPAD